MHKGELFLCQSPEWIQVTILGGDLLNSCSIGCVPHARLILLEDGRHSRALERRRCATSVVGPFDRAGLSDNLVHHVLFSGGLRSHLVAHAFFEPSLSYADSSKEWI